MGPLDEYASVCRQAVLAAGGVLREKLGRVRSREKGPSDLVTEADFASQEVVARIVLDAFPEHGFLGEEQGIGCEGTSGYRWIVDPLDGTTNYVHQVPLFAVSLALERAGEVLVGAVYAPMLDEIYTATAGGGAYLNGEPLHVSGAAQLSQTLVATGLPAQTPPESPDLRVFVAAAAQCQSVRRTGCASLNLCYVAAGRYDMFYSFSTKVWDVAAGILLVREAGGMVTTPEGAPQNLQTGQVVASATDLLHRASLAMVAQTLA